MTFTIHPDSSDKEPVKATLMCYGNAAFPVKRKWSSHTKQKLMAIFDPYLLCLSFMVLYQSLNLKGGQLLWRAMREKACKPEPLQVLVINPKGFHTASKTRLKKELA